MMEHEFTTTSPRDSSGFRFELPGDSTRKYWRAVKEPRLFLSKGLIGCYYLSKYQTGLGWTVSRTFFHNGQFNETTSQTNYPRPPERVSNYDCFVASTASTYHGYAGVVCATGKIRHSPFFKGLFPDTAAALKDADLVVIANLKPVIYTLDGPLIDVAVGTDLLTINALVKLGRCRYKWCVMDVEG